MSDKPFDVLTFLQTLPFLDKDDHQGLLWVLNNCPEVEGRYDGCSPTTSTGWSQLATISQIKVSRQSPVPPERVYKIRGIGKIHASIEDVTEMIINDQTMKMWDSLLKEVYCFEHKADPLTGTEVAIAYLIYTVPGMSSFFYDRTFFDKVVLVTLPDGVRVIYFGSLDGKPEYEALNPPEPRYTVRGHIGPSGYVLKPEADGNVSVTLILQVDAKGSIPTFIINLCNLAIPLSIDTMRNLHKSGKCASILAAKERKIDKTPLLGKNTGSAAPAAAGTAVQGKGGDVATAPPPTEAALAEMQSRVLSNFIGEDDQDREQSKQILQGGL